MAVSTSKGNLHVFLSKLPLIGSAHQSKVAYLTSLLEVTIASVLEQGRVSAEGQKDRERLELGRSWSHGHQKCDQFGTLILQNDRDKGGHGG